MSSLAVTDTLVWVGSTLAPRLAPFGSNSLFICPPFILGGLTCRDNSNLIFRFLYRNDVEQSQIGGLAQILPAVPAWMVVPVGEHERIDQDGCRLLEGDAMFPD